MLNNKQQLFFPAVLIKFWICLVQGLTDFQDTVYDEFVAKLKAAVEKNMVLGNGLEAGINQVRIASVGSGGLLSQKILSKSSLSNTFLVNDSINLSSFIWCHIWNAAAPYLTP